MGRSMSGMSAWCGLQAARRLFEKHRLIDKGMHTVLSLYYGVIIARYPNDVHKYKMIYTEIHTTYTY